MSRKVALYARVSTRGQELENQLAELIAVCARNDWQIVHIFTDFGISGAKGRGARKGLDDLLKAVVRREIDQVCIWSIDRLGRSLRDLINVLDELRQKGCELYVHKQAIDTNTTSGKMLFQMLGVFAEFEREIIRERIIAGQQRARAQGKRIGRKSVIDKSLQARAMCLKSNGLSLRKIGERLNVSTATVLKAIAAQTSSASSSA
jgi:DNA invertase Pin-like site-specific DNA recombinase